MSELGTALLAWRRKQRLTMRDAAKQIGVSAAAYSNWEKGGKPKDVHASILTEVTGVTVTLRPASPLERLIGRSGLTKKQVFQAACIDESLLSKIVHRHVPRYCTAMAIADILVVANAALEADVCLWLLSLGYAPWRLVTATKERKLAALQAVGVGS